MRTIDKGFLVFVAVGAGIMGHAACPVRSRMATGSPPAPASPLDAAFAIDGREVRLVGGRHEEPAAPGSAAVSKIQVIGRPAFGDLDGDGEEDAAVFLSFTSGGSGTFFYVAAAIRRNGVYHGTNGVRLGDRIVPRTLEIRSGVIAAVYAGRRAGEPMAASATVLKRRELVLKNGELVDLSQGRF